MAADEGNIRLRKWQDSDVKVLSLIANNPNVSKLMNDRFPYPYGEKDAAEFISGTGDSTEDLAITENDVPIGGIGIVPAGKGKAEVGYWLSEDSWNKGIMSYVLPLYIGTILSKYPDLELFASVFPGNHASVRVLLKSGFSFTGEEHRYISMRIGSVVKQIMMYRGERSGRN
jgi:RimJ/RimL family protein N-acetyltransferase